MKAGFFASCDVHPTKFTPFHNTIGWDESKTGSNQGVATRFNRSSPERGELPVAAHQTMGKTKFLGHDHRETKLTKLG